MLEVLNGTIERVAAKVLGQTFVSEDMLVLIASAAASALAVILVICGCVVCVLTVCRSATVGIVITCYQNYIPFVKQKEEGRR